MAKSPAPARLPVKTPCARPEYARRSLWDDRLEREKPEAAAERHAQATLICESECPLAAKYACFAHGTDTKASGVFGGHVLQKGAVIERECRQCGEPMGAYHRQFCSTECRVRFYNEARELARTA